MAKHEINEYDPYQDREEHDFYNDLGEDMRQLQECIRQGREVVNRSNLLFMHMSSKIDDHFTSQMDKRRKEDERRS